MFVVEVLSAGTRSEVILSSHPITAPLLLSVLVVSRKTPEPSGEFKFGGTSPHSSTNCFCNIMSHVYVCFHAWETAVLATSLTFGSFCVLRAGLDLLEVITVPVCGCWVWPSKCVYLKETDECLHSRVSNLKQQPVFLTCTFLLQWKYDVMFWQFPQRHTTDLQCLEMQRPGWTHQQNPCLIGWHRAV